MIATKHYADSTYFTFTTQERELFIQFRYRFFFWRKAKQEETMARLSPVDLHEIFDIKSQSNQSRIKWPYHDFLN